MAERQPPEVSAELYSSGMLRRFGWAYYASGLFLALRRVTLSDDSAERVRRAMVKGPVVYALRTRSYVDYLALNQVLQQRRLPLPAFGTGIRNTFFRPLMPAVRHWRRRAAYFMRHGRLPHPVASGWLRKFVAGGHHAAVFLQPESTWRDIFRVPDWPDPVSAVLEAQEEREDPIQVLPIVVIWHRGPERARNPTMQVLLGTEEDPTPISKLAGVIFGHREPLVQVGAPVDLHEYLERVDGETVRNQSKRLRLLLRRYCYREAQVVRGARQKSHRWMRRLVLRSARIRTLAEAESKDSGQPLETIQRQLVLMYDRMAARFSYPVLFGCRTALHVILNTLYKGIDVRPEDIERVRKAKRDGVCVLVPCHRSHIDYLLLSKMLWDHDIVPPHIVAGDNLAFFPVGSLFRRAGAIFIRRRFDDALFPGLFQAYLTQLFREGHTVEFFIEGGRSRTGKLLPPKLGILGYTVDAGVEARVGRSLEEVTWLPVGITYERVAEEAPYARELSGAEKEPESLAQVAKAGRVLFERYGKVHVRVGEPLQLSQFLEELSGPWSDLNRDQRREALQGLAERILHRIDTTSVVAPSALVAMALLAQSESDVAVSVLESRIRRFSELIGPDTEARTLSHPGKRRRKALSRLLRDGLVERAEVVRDTVYRVNPDRRITLEYYKNSALHLCATASFLAIAIGALGKERFTAEELGEDFRFLLYLLRYEFVLDPEADELEIERRGLKQLEASGAITVLADGSWTVLGWERLRDVAALTTNFLESYHIVLRALFQLRMKRVPEKQFAKEAQKVGRQLLEMGDIKRPESLSLVNLKNALKAFREDGVYAPRSDGGQQIHEGAHSEYLSTIVRLEEFQA
ncbi:MAG: 1-acyl-sn-glycerol-3-phosphate acyltransferase [Myxococcota bacterium]|nr:1-acyl-sn-glycerol-3-phosphate acyltransferase [Myxococcota bacterium]